MSSATGDSLDGTLARVRNQLRPRYGYYLDHVIDLTGTALVFAGLAASGHMSPIIAVLVVAAFFLVSAESCLATHARGIFSSPVLRPVGLVELRLFDLGGIVGVAGMVVTFVIMSVRNAHALYLEETVRS